MNIWQQHIAYLKDNPEGYWFKRKLYGWGWTPATKAGWLVTLLFLIFVAVLVVTYEEQLVTLSDGEFVVGLLAGLLLFLTIVAKTGESPRWQWGDDSGSTK